jgi:predicted DNA binding CopG/RHH family protein
MKNIKVDDMKLTTEEELLEKELLKGEYESDQNEESKEMWAEAIAQYRELSQTKQMTIRVDAGDLIKVKAKAKENSMPYQTLLKILFKQFAEGKVAIRV